MKKLPSRTTATLSPGPRLVPSDFPPMLTLSEIPGFLLIEVAVDPPPVVCADPLELPLPAEAVAELAPYWNLVRKAVLIHHIRRWALS
jgi:hypothetical protein